MAAQDAAAAAAATATANAPKIWKDANGNVLHDGDTVIIIKDLKRRDASSALKVGTKVRNTASSTAITTSTARSTASARCS